MPLNFSKSSFTNELVIRSSTSDSSVIGEVGPPILYRDLVFQFEIVAKVLGHCFGPKLDGFLVVAERFAYEGSPVVGGGEVDPIEIVQ